MEVGQRVPSLALVVLTAAFVVARPISIGETWGVDAVVAAVVALVCAGICGAALHRLARVRPSPRR